ncbi:hypothetical protein CYMTET_11021 [Cymbomonas tetramitiformis]|uniref:B30.2/SPRY domain-containing protein n=1 Tax=Cymbomonas tetramitiformis TaxID=36881 RepID=A0AAE0GN42_9CHLO|nr:hypothetical protein CYMTET_11021 [Cymbomonas tetramitiformis]
MTTATAKNAASQKKVLKRVKQALVKVTTIDQATELLAHFSKEIEAEQNHERALQAKVDRFVAEASVDGEDIAEGRLPEDVLSRLQDALRQIGAGLIERDAEARLVLLAALTGEHLLLLGPPGTAKSELGRRLNKVLAGGKYFERLLTKFSTPEELFGPLSIRQLEQDIYERKIEGYLPDSTVAFIDEIFKANSSILNTLLTIMNERTFHNGAFPIATELVCMVGASNEMPESEELEALFDRFLIRRWVEPVSTSGFMDLVTGKLPSTQPDAIEAPALREADVAMVRKYADSVTVPVSILKMVLETRVFLKTLKDPPCTVSDRRWKKVVSLLKVVALTSGRMTVIPTDLLVLQHCLWSSCVQRAPIAKFLKSLIVSSGVQKEGRRRLLPARKLIAEHKKSKSEDLQALHRKLCNIVVGDSRSEDMRWRGIPEMIENLKHVHLFQKLNNKTSIYAAGDDSKDVAQSGEQAAEKIQKSAKDLLRVEMLLETKEPVEVLAKALNARVESINYWNPKDCHPEKKKYITVSGKNLVCIGPTESSRTNGLCRAKYGYVHGVHKWTVEMTRYSSSGSGYHSIGVCSKNVDVAKTGDFILGNNKDAVGLFLNSLRTRVNGNDQGSFGSDPSTGDTIGVELDMDKGFVTYTWKSKTKKVKGAWAKGTRIYPAIEMGALKDNTYTANFKFPHKGRPDEPVDGDTEDEDEDEEEEEAKEVDVDEEEDEDEDEDEECSEDEDEECSEDEDEECSEDESGHSSGSEGC